MSRRRSNGDSGSASYGRRSAASGRSAFSDSSVGGTSASGANHNSRLARIASRALGTCFGSKRGSWPVSEIGDASEASQLTSAVSNRSTRTNGLRDSRRASHRLEHNPGHKEPREEDTAFTLADIKRATKNFSPTHKIGQGGFGTVYKGVLRGELVAIKRGKKSMYDKQVETEFQSEVSALASIEHLNLVRYKGYLENGEERILVVEYVPNGTLRDHLDGNRGGVLDLAARLDIAVDVSHAITYLHMYADHPIIHRDIKSSNILLTKNLRAKVADFGFARLGSMDDDKTSVSTQVKGTAGYMDPEYLQTYRLTEKSDVYSFGILLVELITGRRPIESKREVRERLTARWVMKMFTDGKSVEVLDPNLPPNPAAILALEQILELAFKCLAPTKHARPNMRKCAEILWNVRKEYREQQSGSDTLSQFSQSQRSSSQEDIQMV